MVSVEIPSDKEVVEARDSGITNQTIEFWSKRTGRRPTEEQARESIQNINGFFGILDKWDRRARFEARVCDRSEAQVDCLAGEDDE